MPSNLSSGDLLADRRYGVGEALAAEGDHEAAADLFEQTLERVPDWAPAWLALALAHDKAGRRPAALDALRRAETLDPSGGLGAGLHRARLEGGAPPSAMPAAFVRALFDQYADRFDSHLVEGLRYRGPALIVEALDHVGAEAFQAALDLGCGTGLMARAVAGRAQAIDGVDLAPLMVEQARRTGLYRSLAVGEIGAHLAAAEPARHDLVVAADVLVYLGVLDAIFAGVARVLTPGGTFAFTAQALEGSAGYRLGDDMRFSHGRRYLADALNRSGLTILRMEGASTREDRGIPVPGLVVVARQA